MKSIIEAERKGSPVVASAAIGQVASHPGGRGRGMRVRSRALKGQDMKNRKGAQKPQS